MTLSSSATTLLESKPDLKVGLQSVLRSLDVGLEDELARYRRKKRLQQLETPTPRPMRRQATPVEEARVAIAQLTQLPGLGDGVNSVATPESEHSAASSAAAAPSVPQVATIQAEAAEAAQSSGEAADAGVPPTSSLVNLVSSDNAADSATNETAPLPQSSDLARTGETDDYFASSAALLESLAQEEALPDESRKLGRLGDRLMTPAGVGASMLLLLGSATAGYLMLHPESLSHLQLSELRSSNTATVSTGAASTEMAPVNPELPPGAPDLSQKEFVDLTLSNLGRLSLQEQPTPTSSTVLPTTLPAALPAAQTAPLPTVGLPPVPSPTISVPEAAPPAPKRGLLSNLANAVAGVRPPVPGAIAPAPVALFPVAPAPVAPAPAAPSAIRMAPETPLPQVVPAPPVVSLPAPPVLPEPPRETAYFPAPEAPALAEVLPAPVGDTELGLAEPAPEPALTELPAETYGTFVVVTPYKSDLALSQVQQFAPDAYVRNTEAGAVIQVGIHDSAETANSVVEQLQREGFSAYVE